MKKIGDTALGAVVTPIIVTDRSGIIRERNLAAELSMSCFKKLSRIDKYLIDESCEELTDAKFYHCLCGSDRYCAYTAELDGRCYWLFFNSLQQGADFLVEDTMPGGLDSHYFLLEMIRSCLGRDGKPDRGITETRIYQLRDVAMKIFNIMFGKDAGLWYYDVRTLIGRLSGRGSALFERYGYTLLIDGAGLYEDSIYPTAAFATVNIILQLILHVMRFTVDRTASLRIYENNDCVCTEFAFHRPFAPAFNYGEVSPDTLTCIHPHIAFETFMLSHIIRKYGMDICYSENTEPGVMRLTLIDPIRRDSELPLYSSSGFDTEKELEILIDKYLFHDENKST